MQPILSTACYQKSTPLLHETQPYREVCYMHVSIGWRWTSSLPCCSGACFSLPFAIPRTPATLGFCASGIGGLSKEPLRFNPREEENKSNISLNQSAREVSHCLKSELKSCIPNGEKKASVGIFFNSRDLLCFKKERETQNSEQSCAFVKNVSW